jgi:hypothetical protein
VKIGCPYAHNEPPCHRCGGNWPGTKSESSSLIRAAEKGKLNAKKLACGVLQDQATFLIKHFANGDGKNSK